MHRVFQAFIDGLAASGDTERLRTVLADAGAALDLSCFAYLSMPSRRGDAAELISNYPVEWTEHYLREHYERVDPVIVEALKATEPFEWGQEFTTKRLSKPQCALLDEAAQFGIRCGFTVPVHDSRGPVAAVTFAADERRATFQRCVRAESARAAAHSDVLSCSRTPKAVDQSGHRWYRVVASRTRMSRMGRAGQICMGNWAPAEYFSAHGGVSSRQCKDEVWRQDDMPGRRQVGRL